MKVYRIYIDGQETDYFYDAETEEEALKMYDDDFVEEYRYNYKCEPIAVYMGDVRAIDITCQLKKKHWNKSI